MSHNMRASGHIFFVSVGLFVSLVFIFNLILDTHSCLVFILYFFFFFFFLMAYTRTEARIKTRKLLGGKERGDGGWSVGGK